MKSQPMPLFAFRSRRRRRTARFGPAACLAALLALLGASSAGAATTIGQLAPGTSPPATCVASPFDLVQPTVTGGNSYVVPPGGDVITSWSTNAAAGSGQIVTMKIFRKVAEPLTFRVVGHEGPRALVGGTLNTFPANIPVQGGDILGINDGNASSVPNACFFSAPGDFIPEFFGDLADGAEGDFSGSSDPNARVNATAVVAFQPSNDFSLGKVKRNKDKGIATLAVNVPGPGTLALTGKGVKKQRSGRAATASKAVSAAGTVKLRIKSKGKKKRKLNDNGKVKVKVKVTYTPTGDLPGVPNTEPKRVKLIKED